MPAGLSESGRELWADVADGRKLSVAHQTLLLNVCRIADRLDELADELAGRPLVVVDAKGTETPNPLLTEHRMQFQALSQIMQRLGVKELPSAGAGQKSLKDQLAERRAQRAQRAVQ